MYINHCKLPPGFGKVSVQVFSPATPPEPQGERCNCRWDGKGPVNPEILGHDKSRLGRQFARLKGKEVHAKDRLLRRLCYPNMLLQGVDVRLTDTKVDGKNAMVTTAIAFVAEASFFASPPIRACILLSS
jgi:hypothetical protein